jgi:hypothetical protein
MERIKKSSSDSCSRYILTLQEAVIPDSTRGFNYINFTSGEIILSLKTNDKKIH